MFGCHLEKVRGSQRVCNIVRRNALQHLNFGSFNLIGRRLTAAHICRFTYRGCVLRFHYSVKNPEPSYFCRPFDPCEIHLLRTCSRPR